MYFPKIGHAVQTHATGQMLERKPCCASDDKQQIVSTHQEAFISCHKLDPILRTQPALTCPRPSQPQRAPVYRGISPDWMRGLESCVCSSSFTRSIGATAVFDTAPATPPAIRSAKKRNAGDVSGFFTSATAGIKHPRRSLPRDRQLQR